MRLAAPLAASDGATGDAVPRRTVWFVRLFLIAFVSCALLRIEAWPLTGWRLFSHLRHPVQTSGQVWVTDAAGVERPMPVARLPRGYHWATHVVKGFPSLDRGERTAVCRAWFEAMRAIGRPAVAIAIYDVTTDLSRRSGDRSLPGTRNALRFRCPSDRQRASDGAAGA